MGLSEAQLKSLIIIQLRDTQDGYLTNNIDLFWGLHADKLATAGLNSVFLLAKVEAAEGLIGYYRNQVTFSSSGDLSVQLGERIKLLEGIIARSKEELRKRRGGSVVGQLETKAPVSPEQGMGLEPRDSPFIDANDLRYGGNPYPAGRGSDKIP